MTVTLIIFSNGDGLSLHPVPEPGNPIADSEIALLPLVPAVQVVAPAPSPDEVAAIEALLEAFRAERAAQRIEGLEVAARALAVRPAHQDDHGPAVRLGIEVGAHPKVGLRKLASGHQASIRLDGTACAFSSASA